MNSKEFKADKKSKKYKTKLKNGGQQVFVLPPNLLQKLGINLESMGSTSISSDMGYKMSTFAQNHKHGQSSSNIQHQLNSNIINNDTSIVKTASLMKESVLLSPTFNTASSNNVINSHIEGYVDICNPETNHAIEDSKAPAEKYNSANVMSQHDFQKDIQLEDTHNGNDCSVDMSIENASQSRQSINSNSEKFSLQNETKKVINIISEENVTAATFNELKVLQIPSNNAMIPASLNTIIFKNAKMDSRAPSPTLPMGVDEDLQYPEPDEILISNEIDIQKIENALKMDPKLCHKTENLCDSVDVNHIVDEENVQHSENIDITESLVSKGTELSVCFDNDSDQIILNGTIDKTRSDCLNAESESGLSACHNNFDVLNDKSVSTDEHYNEDIKISTLLNGHDLDHSINNNESLSENYTNEIKEDNTIIFEIVRIDAAPRIECRSPDVTTTNNNTWDTNSDVDNTIVSDQQKNIETNDLISDKDNSFNGENSNTGFMATKIEQNTIINLPEDSSSVIFETVENTSVCEQETSIETINDNKEHEESNNLKSQTVSDAIDDGAVNNLSLPLNPKRNNLMSKLCIQGVEKPGGNISDIQNSVPLKTYSNKRKNNIQEKNFLPKDTILNVQFDSNSNIDSSDAITDSLPSQQFCKCFDYGNLDYNQLENFSQHVHFTRKIPIDCSPELIFGIYNNEATNIDDTSNNFHMEISDNVQHTEDIADKNISDNYICWYNADSLEIECDTKKDNSQKEKRESEIKDREQHFQDKPKRKRSNNCDEVSDNKRIKSDVNEMKQTENELKNHVTNQGFRGWNNINVSKPQESVKCGICHIHVINAQWLKHIASTHDYIAWKEGEPPVDLEDEDAIRLHLHQVVQELGQLECSNCGLTRKYAKPFLQHIKTCYNSSNKNNEQQVPYHLSKIIEVVTVINTKCDHCGYESKSHKDYTTHMKRCIVKSELLNKNSDNSHEEDAEIVTCGVCEKEMMAHQWISHIQEEHSYQAWRKGEKPLNFQDPESIWKHLYSIIQEHGPLVCSKCGISRKYAKLFLQHISSCTGPKEQKNTFDTSNAELESILQTSLNDSGLDSTKLVTCGRCQLEMKSKDWITHIQEKHNYISWQEGQNPINITDEEAVRRYLYVIVQKLGTLTCANCGVPRKYVRGYLSHVEHCMGPLNLDGKNSINTSINTNQSNDVDKSMDGIASVQQLDRTLPLSTTDSQLSSSTVTMVKCGVCQKEMKDSNWISHISINHEYLAWKETETKIDLNNYETISQHLINTIEKISFLKCADCGNKFKHAKNYLVHIKACYGKTYVEIDDWNITPNDSVSDVDDTLGMALDGTADMSMDMSVGTSIDSTLNTTCAEQEENDTGTVECGVCHEEMESSLWKDHRHKQHNYLAWRDGDTAIDLESKVAIRNHLKIIVEKYGRLTCAKCGLRRRKVIPFAIHIRTCNGNRASSEGSSETEEIKREKSGREEIVKCAVCESEMAGASWIDHIYKEHNYMAWKSGDKPLNVDDEISVKDHLYKISHEEGGLICKKCGLVRKYVKSYLQHIRGCTGSEESTQNTPKALPEDELKKVTCALCRLVMNGSVWMEHIAKEHNYVAWKENDPPLVFEDEKALRDHLYNIVQSIGCLVCNKCGLVRKYAKSYLLHIESCQKITWKNINSMTPKATKEEDYMVRCAVCHEEVNNIEWLQHSGRQHNYLAWRDGDPALNLDDEDEVRGHLKQIIRKVGFLVCPKCRLQRKYAKLFLHHVNTCDGSDNPNNEMDDSINETDVSSASNVPDPDDSRIMKCGVCAVEVTKAEWFAHIQKAHKYLAWEEGTEPLDVNDKEQVYNHLSAINAKCNGLTCESCGVVRKYVRAYLQHVHGCKERNYRSPDENIECGVCGEKMLGKAWKDHTMSMHYNIAWTVGDNPIDFRNFFCVDKYLKDYLEYKHKLVCNICGLHRASLAGFYAHILVCGKTEEEIDSWKDVCTICNQKYLCIYKTQHYWAHRVAEVAKERKNQATLQKEEYLKDEVNLTPGRRRAAEKARSVIGDYAAKFSSHKCKSCSFESESKEDLANHRCAKRAANDDSDESASIKLEDYSEEESEDTDVDSGLSNEEEGAAVTTVQEKKVKKDKSKLPTKTSKFPFNVRDVKSYLQQSKLDYFEMYYTRETLFPHWKDYKCEVVTDDLIPKYLPQMEESCKLSISNNSWTTYKRFESKKENGCKVMFTGGSIQCISWAPAHPDSTPECRNFLAVSTHRGPDCPRLHSSETSSHPALIQIWDFKYFKRLPKLALGIAHDYGTVWAMDWCPSGARDLSQTMEADNVRPRLGLLALACSNGSAYVVPVPYPDENQTSDINICKIKPCVELKLTRGDNKYQATSVNWSLFKGYTNISVGYGDGTVAMYDLVTESPLLITKNDDFDILYPFQDERVHNSCVTGLTSSVLGAWCSSSVTGSTAGVAATEPRAGRGAHPLRAHTGLAASVATFMPHWPNLMLSGDETIVGLSPSELEWGYVGRRVGSVRALAPCLHRARVTAVVPPLLQVMRPHPAAFKGHKTINKKNVAMIQMKPLSRKRTKHTNDELSMKVEPATYEEAITSYGIVFKFERDFDKAFVQRMQQKNRVPYPERFPLADVPALAYCPAADHYTKLAVATHAGILFLIDV